jgi:hypothetical protein
MSRSVILLALFLMVGLPISARSQCSLGAWVEDPELPKATTKVHRQPNLSSRALAEIPFAGDEDGDQAILQVTGFSTARVDRYSTGWVRVSSAVTVDGKELFKGDGWIPASRVRTNVQTPTNKAALIYNSPSKKASRAGTLPTESMVEIVGFNCFGFKVKHKQKVGWLPREHSCGNPVTTCV